MKILVFGATGMLGHKLVQELSKTEEVFATVRISSRTAFERLKIIDPCRLVNFSIHYDICEAIRSCHPDAVINCIGIVKQLEQAKYSLPTITTNSLFPHQLNEACRHLDIKRMIHVSTDCVFNGKKDEGAPPYGEMDVPGPEDLYGRSKLLGEVSEAPGVTLRTSIIGRELYSTTGLVEWFLSQKDKKVKGFSKALYTGFTTIEFARVVRHALQAALEPGVYHVSSDEISKFELLELIRQKYEIPATIEKDKDFRCDRRMESSRFRRMVCYHPPPWDEMIEEMAKDPTPYDEWRAK